MTQRRDMCSFEFLSSLDGTDDALPGDEKAKG